MSSQRNSIYQLTLDTFILLSPAQRAAALKNIVFSIAQAIFEVISLTALVPLFYQFINKSKQNSNSNVLQKLVDILGQYPWPLVIAVIITTFVIKNFIGILLTRYQTNFTCKVSLSFSNKLYDRFYKQPWADYLKDNSAEAIRKIKDTPFEFANFIIQNYLLLITETCICIFMLAGVLWFDYRVIIIVLVICLPVSILYYLFRKKVIAKINVSFRDLMPQGSITLTQGIDSFAEARLYNKEKHFINKFMIIRRATAQHLANLTAATSLPSRLFEIAGILCFTGLIIYANVYNSSQQSLIVLLALLSITIYRVVPSINRILTYLAQIQSYAYCITELKESFNSTIEKPEATSQAIVFGKHIELKNVSYRYNHTSNFHLDDVNLLINKGEFVVLEGPSGAGKTTLLHLLAGLVNDYTGSIMIDGIPLKLCKTSWQTTLGFVPQASTVLQGSLLKNVAFGEDDDSIDRERVEAAMELSNLKELIPELTSLMVGENGLTLSGGQRQRLLLARALYRNPDVLLLDEVTNQLDEVTKLEILTSLKNLTLKGKTLVIASHDALVKKFATQVFNVVK